LSNHPVGTQKRLEQLTRPGVDLLGYLLADVTEEGYYYLTLRAWPHPDVDDAWTISLRYAYLTAGDGSDGWVDEGMNMRVSGNPATFLQALSQMCASGIARWGGENDPSVHDVTED